MGWASERDQADVLSLLELQLLDILGAEMIIHESVRLCNLSMRVSGPVPSVILQRQRTVQYLSSALRQYMPAYADLGVSVSMATGLRSPPGGEVVSCIGESILHCDSTMRQLGLEDGHR